MKGRIPWNKNLTKETDIRVKKLGEKSSKTKKGTRLGKDNPFFGKHHTKKTRELLSLAHKGKPLSEETKRKLRGRPSWNKGEKHPMFGRTGEKSFWWGKHLSQATKNKKSKAMKKYTGEKNHNWLGGISFEPYSIEFTKQLKESIRKRDNYCCQLCGCPEVENDRKLHVHHIDYDKKNCQLSNLTSLCTGCNSKVNFNREKWTRCFQNKLEKDSKEKRLCLARL